VGGLGEEVPDGFWGCGSLHALSRCREPTGGVGMEMGHCHHRLGGLRSETKTGGSEADGTPRSRTSIPDDASLSVGVSITRPICERERVVIDATPNICPIVHKTFP
jgi:hypothetical protein